MNVNAYVERSDGEIALLRTERSNLSPWIAERVCNFYNRQTGLVLSADGSFQRVRGREFYMID